MMAFDMRMRISCVFFIFIVAMMNPFLGETILISSDELVLTEVNNSNNNTNQDTDKDGFYDLKGENRRLSSEEMVKYYSNLIGKYPIISIEDGMSEDDWDGWKYLTDEIGSKCQLVGDDLFVTNVKRLEKGQ